MTDREKIIKALAPLRASDTAVQEVLDMAEHRNTHTMKKSSRTILIAAVVAVLLIGTALAVTYSSWSPGLQNRLRLTDDEAAELEGAEIVTYPEISDTHDGVTVSLEQAVFDGDTAHLAFRVEGIDIPEGYTLAWGEPELTVGGESAHNWSVGVYEDLHWDGEHFVYGDGTPAPLAEEGFPLPHIVREDGSVEMDVSMTEVGYVDTFAGQEITYTIHRLGIARLGLGPETPEYTAEGPWVLTWTAEGTDTSRTWMPDEPLGHGITLTRVTLSMLSALIEYEYPPLTIVGDHAYDADGNELLEEPPTLYRIIMKDGTEYSSVLGAGTMGPDVLDESELEDGFTYVVDMSLTHIIDPDEVAALVFREVGYGDVPEGVLETYTVTLPD